MVEKDIKQRIKELLIRCFELDIEANQIENISDLEKLGVEINSIAVLEILVNLETEFDISLDESEITSEIARDIYSLEKIVKGKLSV